MKKILSERNIAGMLFILVMVAFSFAYEDSKKRNKHYIISSTPSVSALKTTAAINTSKKNIVPAMELSVSVK
jgi:hypothetical protein